MGYKTSPRVNTEGFPFYLIEDLIKEYRIDYWIETGSASGGSAKEASLSFKKVHSIELIEGRQYKRPLDYLNIAWHEGNSIDILPEIIGDLLVEKKNMQSPIETDPPVYNYAIFFLDAHWSEPYPNNTEYPECPLLEELKIISVYNDSAIIIIDDLRLFCGHPPAPLNPKEWPSLNDIFKLLNEKYPHNTNCIRDDYVLSYPCRLDETFDKEWRGNYTKRYPSAEDKLKQQAKDVYGAFKNYLEL